MPPPSATLPCAQTLDRRPPHRGGWTYADYARLPDDGRRYEILEGRMVMAPAPSIQHQVIALAIYRFLFDHIEAADHGRVFAAPCDVELVPAASGMRATVVQPDVLVVLNGSKTAVIDPARIIGRPDLVIEVTSPGTATYDHRDKLDAYARAGQAELWIVDPLARAIEVFFPAGRISAGRKAADRRLVSAAVCSDAMTIPTRLLRGWKPTVAQALAGARTVGR